MATTSLAVARALLGEKVTGFTAQGADFFAIPFGDALLEEKGSRVREDATPCGSRQSSQPEVGQAGKSSQG
jgi:hypothetical protein